MSNQEPVDIAKAVSVGANMDASGDDDATENKNLFSTAKDGSELRSSAIEILSSLPGINVHNMRAVMERCHSLSDLTTLPEEELSHLLGPINAKQLREFLNKRGSGSASLV